MSAYVVEITGSGGHAGNYLFVDANADGFVDGTELVILLDGTSDTILSADDFI